MENMLNRNNEAQKRWIANHPLEERAHQLLNAYNRNDKKANRGKGDLTVKWIVENIFTKPCTHCGKEGWKVIGCNRLDNSKPHTKDNVEPCCKECNDKLAKPPIMYDQIDTITSEVIKTYKSSREVEKYGFDHNAIKKVSNGIYSQHKGFIWKQPLIKDLASPS